MALIRWAATVGGYTMGSRVLGFTRDILIAAILGASPAADAFFIAFKLPNFMRRLFAEGAMNAAFVPLFAGILERDGRATAKSFAEDTLAVLLWVLLLLVVAAQIAMPWLMQGLAPGFADEPETFDLTVQLTRLTFPYILFISLVSLLGGVLNSLYRFAAVAAAPILLNLCLIAALLGLARWTETPAHALAIGVTGGGVVQLVWLVLAARRAGMALRLRLPRLTPGVKRLLVVAAPAALGAGVAQVNLVIDVVIASLLPPGSVSFLYYADRVNQLPIGVVGVAVGTALLPLLSRQVRAGDEAEAARSLNRAIEFALLLALPAAVALALIASPVVVVLFERGAFGPVESVATGAALVAYAGGLPAFVLIKVLTPGYFARQDTRTPVRVAVLCLLVNVALNLLLMGPLAHVGIALATTLAGWLNVALLAAGLARRGHLRPDARLRRRLPRMAAACGGMAAVLWGTGLGVDSLLAQATGWRILALAALAGAGLAAYAGLAGAAGLVSLRELRGLLRRRG